MENWIIGSRLVILLYCIISYVQGDIGHIPLIVLLTLSYISINMLGYIFRKKFLKMCFSLASIIILAVSAVTVDQLFILLITFDVLELAADIRQDVRVWLIAIAAPVLLCNVDILPDYVLISLLSLLIYILAFKFSTTSITLKKTNESLKDKIDELRSRLHTGNEYEAQVRYLSQLEERNSLAQKIHDRVGHTIAGSIIQLEAAGMILPTDREKAAGIIGKVTENLKEGMESIRSTLRNIKPAPEQLGINRLKLMIEEFSVNNSIRTTFSYKGSLDPITHLQWKIIMENTGEALTNALKYSAATKIDVRLEVLNRLIKAEVRDNGKGTDIIKKGMGLSGMEERTENAGGNLILDGSDGFSVITLLPAGGS